MKSRPILFNDDMVRATLAGRKTVTRRPFKRPSWVSDGLKTYVCPLGVPGDELWVREAHATGIDGCLNGVSYRADHIDPRGDGPAHPMKWIPSILQPRWASRLTLTVTSVRVERVQDITEDGARAEGFDSRAAFADAWSAIYPETPWDANPWVWTVGFEVKR